MKMGLLSYWYRFCYTLWSPFYDLLVRGFVGWRRRSLKLADIQPGERVLIVDEDLWMLGGIVLGISVLASLLGIWRAMKVQPNEVIA